MKKIIICLVFSIALGALTACESTNNSGGLGIPTSPNHIIFKAQNVRSEGYVRAYAPYIEGVEYPIITIISSRAELKLYCDIYERGYNLAAPPPEPTGLFDVIGDYPDDYFKGNFLVLVLLEETSGSIRHRVERIEGNGNIIITRLVPEIGTADMAQWHIIIELDNSFKLEQFQAVLITEPMAH